MTKRQVEKWKVAMGQRLRDAIKEEFGYRKENVFAKVIDVSQGSLSEICTGINTPSALTLYKIAMKTGIDVKYILLG